MATTYKISSELYDVSFGLIALHSSMPAYKVAYYLNTSLGLNLSRTMDDFPLGSGIFPVYEWYNEKNDSTFFLYGNKSKQEESLAPTGFFSQEAIIRTYYLLEEKKESDYFLRIDTDSSKLQKETLTQIKDIDSITLSYSIDVDTLKSKHNLIL